MPRVTKRKTYRRIPKRKVKKTAPKHRRMFRGGRKGCGCRRGGAPADDWIAKAKADAAKRKKYPPIFKGGAWGQSKYYDPDKLAKRAAARQKADDAKFNKYSPVPY